MGRIKRPVAVDSEAALASAERAMLAPAMKVPVVFRKLRRSIFPLRVPLG
jgi:hypothetical protein